MNSSDLELISRAKLINRSLLLNNRIDSLISISKEIEETEREYLREYIIMYRTLTQTIGDDKLIKKWLITYNPTLEKHPINLILSTPSLKELNSYLLISQIN